MSRHGCEGIGCGRKGECALHVEAKAHPNPRLCEAGKTDCFVAVRRVVPAGQWDCGLRGRALAGPFDGLLAHVSPTKGLAGPFDGLLAG